VLNGSADVHQPGGIDVRPVQATELAPAGTPDGGQGYGGGQDGVGSLGGVDQLADNGGVGSGLRASMAGGDARSVTARVTIPQRWAWWTALLMTAWRWRTVRGAAPWPSHVR